MKKLLLLALTAFAFGLAGKTSAQDNTGYFSIQYTMGFGIGDTKDFIESASFRGVTFEWRKMVTENIAVGIDAGWSTFYERRPFATYTRGNESLSGVQFRYMNIAPIFVAGSYFFDIEHSIKPYAGLGIGTLYESRVVDMGVFELRDETWRFAIRPELGLFFEASPSIDLMLTGRYNLGFETQNDPSLNYISLNAGVVFKIW